MFCRAACRRLRTASSYESATIGVVRIPVDHTKMRLIAPIRAVVVGGSVLECLVFGGFGAYTLWLGITLNGLVDSFGNDLNFLAAAALLACAARFGFGAFLMSSRWVDEKIVGGRIIGAMLHLVTTAVAASGTIWLGLSEGHVDPLAIAIAAAVIAIGVVVLVSLFLLAGRDGKCLPAED